MTDAERRAETDAQQQCKHEVTTSFREGFTDRLMVVCEDCRLMVFPAVPESESLP